MGFLEAFNRGLSGDDSYEIAGIQVTCAHCGGTAFDERSAQHGLDLAIPPRLQRAAAREDLAVCNEATVKYGLRLTES